MTNAIFTTRRNPSYDDLPETRYHFPKTYLNQVRQSVGDWIIYYEPRRHDDEPSGREGRQAYFATAKVTELVPDPARRDHFYALVSDYLEFGSIVPFRFGDHYYEQALMRPDGATNRGAFGRAVRLITPSEYENILQAGFAILLARSDATPAHLGLQEEQFEYDRPIIEHLVNRPFRDSAFSRRVKEAYDSTCALTGLRLINGGGRSEVDAAHIRPVGSGHRGPDSLRNGIALSKTMHWMFDRGLVAVSEDYSVLVARSELSEQVNRLLTPDRHLRVPENPEYRPHPAYLRYHRDVIFKGN